MTIKQNDIVKIEKLSQRDVYPIYGRPFNLKEGDLCRVLIVDESDKQYTYCLKKDNTMFWISNESKLIKIKNNKKHLIKNMEYLIKQINDLLDELNN